MQKYLSLVALGTAGFLSGPVNAFEFTGGSLDLSHSMFTEETDVSKTAIQGAVEFGIGQSFGIQANLGYFQLHEVDEDGTNIVLHALYHAGEATSFGAFVGQDDLDIGEVDYLGLEAAHDFGMFGIEGYVADVDDAGGSATLYGLAGTYRASERVGLSASYDSLDLDGGLELNRLALGVDFAVVPEFSVYAEIGSAEIEAFGLSESEPFIGFGATINYGAKNGTTFGQRSVFGLFPGL